MFKLRIPDTLYKSATSATNGKISVVYTILQEKENEKAR